MTEPLDPREFAEVEQAQDPKKLFRYLRETASLDEMKAMNDSLMQVLDVQLGDCILDVGCGTGDEVRRLAATVGPSGRVVGADSPTMVEEARRLGTPGNAEFAVGDAHALPFADCTFDRYRAHRVYMHLREPRCALAEAMRVVRPGGAVVVSEPDWGTLALDADDRDLSTAVVQTIQDAMQDPWIGRRLFGLFREVGLEDVRIAPQFGLFPSYRVAHDFLLKQATEQLVHTETFPRTRINSWLDDLAARDEAGRFFFGGLTVIARGFRPKNNFLRSLKRHLR